MDDNALRALREARAPGDPVDVSEFFGGEQFDDLFETRTADEVDALSSPLDE